MENPLRKQIRSIMKDHKKRQMWYRIVTTLAVVVVFVTTYMLILPAITMENKAECGITEHKHDANCYSSHYEKEKELACTTDSLGVHKHTDACYDAEHKLICGYADFVIHEHDVSCYDKDGNLVCTIPEHKLHQHTPECYQMQKQLVCTQEESVGHTHTPECYTKTQGNLICGKEEHTHGEGCYDAEGNLICTLEEHTHSDECYEWTDVLTCTTPESAGHTHSEACYQDVQVLICEEPAELHTHTAECYKDGVLACGKLELKEHKHSETCFTEKQVLVETLICDRVEHVHTDECYKKSTEETATSEAVTAEEASSQVEETSTEEASTEENSSEEALVIPETTTYTDFKKYVTSMTGTGTEYDKTTGNYKSELRVNFSIPSADVKDANYSYELKYPEGIIVPDKLIGQTFTLKDEDKTTAGTFHFVKNDDGTYSARINFDQDYVNNAGTTITGHLWFEGELKKTTVTDEGKIVISGEDKVKLEIPREEIKYPEDENNKYNINVMKKEASYNKETGKLEYTVYVSSIKGTPDDIDFSDTITVTGMALGTPQITVNKQTMKKYSWEQEGNPSKSETITVDSTYESNTIKMKLPQLPKGKEGQDHSTYVEYKRYEIKYSYDVSSMDVGTLTANNKAHVESKDSKTGEIIRDEDKKDITIENKYEIAKRGDFDSANNRIKWTITLNSKNANIAGGKLTDEMLSMIKSGTDVTITPSEGAKIVRGADGKITSIDFEPVSNEKNTNQYTIIYYTEAEQTWKDQTVRNTVTFKPDGGDDVSGTGDVSIKGGEVKKTVDSAVEAPDGKTAEIKWTVSLVILDGKLPKTTIVDSMSSSHNWVSGNGKGNYLTVKQIKDWGGKYTWKSQNDTIIKYGDFTGSDFELTFTDSDGKTYQYSEIANMGDSSELKFTSFKVELKNDISCVGANKLVFSYATTADLTQAVTGDKNKYINKIEVDGKKDEATYDYTYSKGEIVKTDGNNQTNPTSTTTAGELTWKIKVTTDTKDHQTLTVTDKLPDGVKLTGFIVQKNSGSYNRSEYTVEGVMFSKQSGNFEDEFSIEGSKYENNIFTLVIKRQSGKTLPTAMEFEITVKCEVDGAQKMVAGKKYIFTNEASAKLDDLDIGSSSQTQEWTKKDTTVAKKVVDKSGDYDNTTRRAKYSIVLNPDAEDLVEGTDKLTLEDILDSYDKTYWAEGGNDGVTVQAELIPSTVKLYYAVPDGNGGYTTGEEVTGWAWTYKEEPPSYDHTKHIITATGVPDSTALIFKYEYLITVDVPDKNHTKVSVNINNTAKLSGTSHEGTTGDKSYLWERQAAGGGVTTDKNYILYKVEKGNYGKAVSGAVFQLQKYVNEAYQNIDGKTFTTDQEGKITVLWDANLYEKNVLYRLVEVKAPSGYKLPDGEAPSIEFYFSDENDKTNVLPSQLPIGAFDLSKASHTSYLENEVSQSYVLPETGGTGTYWYTMGGVLLTAGAAFLIYKKHMRKGGRRIW